MSCINHKNVSVHYHTGNYARPKKVIAGLITVALIAIAIGTLALLHQNHTLNFFPDIGKIPMVGSQVLTGIGSSLAVGAIIAAVVYTIQHFQKRKPLEEVYEDIRQDDLPEMITKNKSSNPYYRGSQTASTLRTVYWIKALYEGTLEYHLFLDANLRQNFMDNETKRTDWSMVLS